MQLSIENIVDLLLQEFNIPPDDYVRPPRARHPGWTNRYFLSLIVEHETGPKIKEYEGCGEQTINRAFKKLLWPITGPLNGGNETFKNKLFNLVSIKYCPICYKVLNYTNFDKDANDSYGRASQCKSCTSIKNASFYAHNKDTYHKKYIEDNREDYTARNAKRRATKLNATPSWANLSLIREIYRCAEGMHVDHIIPLQGATVCGLHVENNLQYLTPEENMKKSNKLLQEYSECGEVG